MTRNDVISFMVVFLVMLPLNGLSAQPSRKAPVSPPESSAIRILNAPERVVSTFYHWYLQEIYLHERIECPQVVLRDDGMYHLDSAAHVQFLTESGYFSSTFYQHNLPQYEACNRALHELDTQQIRGYPSDFIEGSACGFLQYMIWTGGQGEDVTMAEICHSTITEHHANVVAVMRESTGDAYSCALVDLVKEQQTWKIDRIVISMHALPHDHCCCRRQEECVQEP